MAIVLIAGGSGLIGFHLSQMLAERGHEVRHFSRSLKPDSVFSTFQWDVAGKTFDETAFKGVTHVINLAGAGIADKRWTANRKKMIIESRTASTRLLKQGIRDYGNDVQAYIAGSAIGYYGNRADSLMTEDEPAGKGFLSESVQVWEAAIREIPEELSLPTLLIRTGIVLSTKGGALKKMLLPLHFFTSIYFGKGQQWYSWIHIDDICRIFLRGVEDSTFRGLYNGVAPHVVPNKTFADTLISATGKTAVLLPAPAFALQAALGEMSHTILDSCKVSAQKLQGVGFRFNQPELLPALKDLLQKKI